MNFFGCFCFCYFRACVVLGRAVWGVGIVV